MTLSRLRVEIRGAVQGVGFRPFVYRLAVGLSLSGWVANDAQGVVIEVEGSGASLDRFLVRLREERPDNALILSLQTARLAPQGYRGFEIRESDREGTKSALVLPDLATCADCLRELFDPGNLRFGYPFTNCTNCGPRFSIIESLPTTAPTPPCADSRCAPSASANTRSRPTAASTPSRMPARHAARVSSSGRLRERC